MAGQIKNHLTQECLTIYGGTGIWRDVKITTCYDSLVSQQWSWDGNLIKSIDTGQCLQFDGSNLTPNDCDSSDIGFFWQFNNNIFISGYDNSQCLTSARDSAVFLGGCGSNYFQYWDAFNQTSNVYPKIVSLQNCATGECLTKYKPNSNYNRWYVQTTKCEDTILSQQWAWFGERLQSMDTTGCLRVDSGSATSALYLDDCGSSGSSSHWQVGGTTIRSEYYNGYCLTSDTNSKAYLDNCGNTYQCWDSTNHTFTFSPTHTTTTPSLVPTANPTYPTYEPTYPTYETYPTTSHPTYIIYPTHFTHPTYEPTYPTDFTYPTYPTVAPTSSPTCPPIRNATIHLYDLALPRGITIYGTEFAAQSISNVGDINGDGYDDFVISIATEYTYQSGTGYIVFGNNANWQDMYLNDVNIIQVIKINGINNNGFSFAVSGAGDVNGDGYDDIIIGTPYAGLDRGAGYLLWGKKAGWSDIDLQNLNIFEGIKIHSIADYDITGYSVSSAGDVNGDGYADFLIGIFNTANIYLIFGKSTGWQDIYLNSITSLQAIKIRGYGSAGKSVSGVGDVNGDGYDDFLIGVPDSQYSDVGKSYLIFGKNANWTDINLLNDLNFPQVITILGDPQVSGSGSSVSYAGDINGDGYNDFLITAPGGSYDIGTTYLLFGKKLWFSDINLANLTITEGIKIQGMGYYSDLIVSDAGDINKDGYNDFLIGTGRSESCYSNAAYLIVGKKTGWENMNLTNLHTSQGIKIQGDNGDFGTTLVSGAGDVNGDGYDDFLIAGKETYLLFGDAVSSSLETTSGSNDDWVVPVVATVASVVGVAILGTICWCTYQHLHHKPANTDFYQPLTEMQ